MVEDDAYKQAAESGLYEKPSGLKGKYDHVRRFWEDEVTRLFMKPHLQNIVKSRSKDDKKLRILDLGCGSGDGYDLLHGLTSCDSDMNIINHKIFPEKYIEEYMGLDLNPELLAQGEAIFSENEKVNFEKGDFLEGLGLKKNNPYDIYLANYGTLSHCNDEEVVELLVEIAEYSKNGSLIIGDWLGSFSYEWQDLWIKDPSNNYFMDYVISYIYDEEKRENLELESFPLRLMNAETLFSIVDKASQKSTAGIHVRKVFDRSIFVGRHIETGEYQQYPQPIRTNVNSLLELGLRTDLEKVKVNYYPKEGFEFINTYFKDIAYNWNTLIDFTNALLNQDINAKEIEDNNKDSKFLSTSFNNFRHLVDNALKLDLEDARANIIEPQLAYMLRNLEITFQRASGMGHGLGLILEINK